MLDPRTLLGLVLLAPAVAAQTWTPLELEPGDTIAILGNRLAEDMQHEGFFEARLQARFPELGLSVRNLGFSGDEVGVHQRTMNFGKFSEDPLDLDLPEERWLVWDRYLEHVEADVVLAMFGCCEAFGGEEGLDAFRADLHAWLDHATAARWDAGRPSTIVLVGPIQVAPVPDRANEAPPASVPGVTDEMLQRYGAAMRDVAAEHEGVRFVDPMAGMTAATIHAAGPLFTDGVHLNTRGAGEFADVLERALFGPGPRKVNAYLLDAVREKNAWWHRRYQAVDGYNLYGDRSRLAYDEAGADGKVTNFEVLQAEMDRLDAVVASHDRRIHAMVRGEQPPVEETLAPLPTVGTNKPGPLADGAYPFHSGEAAIAAMTTAPGLRVNLFADEAMFPELVNAHQMAWGPAGKLWVLTWPSYPSARADRLPHDRLLVLEDTDGDGRADTCTTFADDLADPTGLEHWNGGVFVACAPELLFLKDTDGDGQYDARERVLTGLSSADTHHAANSFVLGPDGALYFQEGTFHRSQIETIHGVLRSRNACAWRYEPRTRRLERYVPYDFANPHGHVFDAWGQDFLTDGTGNVNYYVLPFSGHLPEPLKKPGYFPFFQQRSRPAGGTEIVGSPHFPASMQGNYLVANVIGFRGIFQYEVEDDGSGFAANEVDPIVESRDPNFRPVDVETGPDGALYFLDWHNPLIGHMQHHIRDPSRDRRHGRVYRVTHEAGAPFARPDLTKLRVEEVVEQLDSPDLRTRYLARIELSGRDLADDQVERRFAARRATPDADPIGDLELLWLAQREGRMPRELLDSCLGHADFRVRAAAVRVVRQMRRELSGALEHLRVAAEDRHPRVRLEAVVAASFFEEPAAVEVVALAAERETDRFLDYAIEESLRGLEPIWRAGLVDGALDLEAKWIDVLLERVDGPTLLALPRSETVLYAILIHPGVAKSDRAAAAADLLPIQRRQDRELEESSVHVTYAYEVPDDLPARSYISSLAWLGRRPADPDPRVVRELGDLLLEDPARVPRGCFDYLAGSNHRPAVRIIGIAGLIALYDEAEAALSWGSSTLERIPLALQALRRTEAAANAKHAWRFALEHAAYPPARLAQGGPGLDVAFYEPAPRDARRESLAHRRPVVQTTAETVTDRLDLVGTSDSFALVFTGLLEVPAGGTWTFATNSDDGSRLYVGDTCVVDNDGDHSRLRAEGSIELTAGKHAFGVTYYERGGGNSLDVTWSGPGVDEQEIPASAYSTSGAFALRAEAIRTLAHLPGHVDEKLEHGLAWLDESGLGGAPLELLASVADDPAAAARAEDVTRRLLADLRALPVAARTSPSAERRTEVARAFAAHLDDAARDAVLAELDLLGGTVLAIGTLPHRMLYDVEEFFVAAGSAVAIDFSNADSMPHNLVVVKPGAMEAVGLAAERSSSASAAYVPDHDAVLFHTGLVNPGGNERLAFRAPSEPGAYPYVCTYPGHWRVMHGTMHVVEALDASQREVERFDAGDVVARAFVRDWTFDDLADRFEGDWHAGRDAARGEQLFRDAGCLTCHCASKGVFAGPNLADLRPELRGKELLRHVLAPSLAIAEGYAYQGFDLADGTRATGRLLEEDDEDFVLVEVNGSEARFVPKAEVVDRWTLDLSPMPTGLLVTLDEGEILDLLHYVETVGQPADADLWLDLPPAGDGPGAGLRVVLLAGDEEYRSEESMPMLGRLLAERFGFHATVLFATDPVTGAIDPTEPRHVPGMHLLDDADLVICQWRFRELDDVDMARFVRYVESGKPVIGLRTATHAFHYVRNPKSPYAHWTWNSKGWPGGFGRQVLGETWVAHHGHHGVESTRGVHAPDAADHPILRGVGEPWGPTDVYTVRELPADATVLLRGAVLDGMTPSSSPVAGPKNEPLLPVAWTRERALADGTTQRVFTTTMGSSTDFADPNLRRLLVNAALWCLEREDRIQEDASVETVGTYEPTPFGFGGHRSDLRVTDLR